MYLALCKWRVWYSNFGVPLMTVGTDCRDSIVILTTSSRLSVLYNDSFESSCEKCGRKNRYHNIACEQLYTKCQFKKNNRKNTEAERDPAAFKYDHDFQKKFILVIINKMYKLNKHGK